MRRNGGETAAKRRRDYRDYRDRRETAAKLPRD
jgi:hypothetical protein